jgi:hypothetical protein
MMPRAETSPPEFEEVDPAAGLGYPNTQKPKFSGGLAPLKTGRGKFFYVDLSGKVAIPGSYRSGYNFSEGLAAVKVGYKWGYINRSGKVVWQSAQ